VSNEYTQFLRDFAEANIDSFEDEQLRMLRNAAREIETLIEEREEARRDHLGLLKEVKDLTERHAHMSNIALGARADVHQTRRDLDKANKERDSSRRLACFLRAEIESTEPLIYCRKVAEEYKWDCFKDDSAWGYDEEEANANNNLFRSTDMS